LETTNVFLNFVAYNSLGIRPILIIREVMNFDGKTSYDCSHAMEKTKEGGILFPIILVTSDTLWFKVLAVKTSKISFDPYYIKDMSFNEGKHELAERFNMWSLEYRYIYSTICGHCGSYSLMWLYVYQGNYTIEKALSVMEHKETVHLQDCIIHGEIEVDQAVCTVGQTNGHSSPYHATSHTGIQWDRIGPQATLLMPLKSLTGSMVFLLDLTGLKTGRL